LAKRRRPSRRRSRRLTAIPFVARLTLGALVSSIVIKVSSLPAAFGEDFYIHSVFANWAMRNYTAGEGPISIGYTHGDLSVTEVLEALTAEVTDPDDIIAKERSRRPVRKLGNFPGLNTEETFQDGRMVRSGIGFTVGDGHQFECWALNNSAATLTTGTILEIDGVLYGRWLR